MAKLHQTCVPENVRLAARKGRPILVFIRQKPVDLYAQFQAKIKAHSERVNAARRVKIGS